MNLKCVSCQQDLDGKMVLELLRVGKPIICPSCGAKNNPGNLKKPSPSAKKPASQQPTYTHQYTIAVPPKSVGISILLTIFLGPLGLFYSTIRGALIMLGLPFLILMILAAIGIIMEDFPTASFDSGIPEFNGIIEIIGTILFTSTLASLGLLFLLSFPICVIWGVLATRSYNQKLLSGRYRGGDF